MRASEIDAALRLSEAVHGSLDFMTPDPGLTRVIASANEARLLDERAERLWIARLEAVSRRAEGPARPLDVLLPIAAARARAGRRAEARALVEPHAAHMAGDSRLAASVAQDCFALALALGEWPAAHSLIAHATRRLEAWSRDGVLALVEALCANEERAQAGAVLSEAVALAPDAWWIAELAPAAVRLAQHHPQAREQLSAELQRW